MTRKQGLRTLFVGLLAGTFLLVGCSFDSTNSTNFPEFTAPVVDAVGAIDDIIESELSAELEQFRVSSGPQIAVAVIDTTGQRSIEDYSIDLAREWGVGDSERDDGVLLLIALEDRKLRIEVGSGVEGDLTDVAAGRIVDEVMLPLLRNDDVTGAVLQGARATMSVWRGETLPAPTINNDPTVTQGSAPDWLGILLFFLFIGGSTLLAIIGQFARHTTWTSGGSRRGYGGIFIPGGFGSSGFGGGGGFGGFGGGGGGFSGGGAGGSW